MTREELKDVGKRIRREITVAIDREMVPRMPYSVRTGWYGNYLAIRIYSGGRDSDEIASDQTRTVLATIVEQLTLYPVDLVIDGQIVQ